MDRCLEVEAERQEAEWAETGSNGEMIDGEAETAVKADAADVAEETSVQEVDVTLAAAEISTDGGILEVAVTSMAALIGRSLGRQTCQEPSVREVRCKIQHLVGDDG